ncbi:hypothetical protein [Burkholderia cepacia]|uniref:hypothetical protein n=1 Tax=Burkholderia cepacia TaxID=292 RepID=UPI00158A046A|nr:hypothetical protein [Burkholderia cepacia]
MIPSEQDFIDCLSRIDAYPIEISEFSGCFREIEADFDQSAVEMSLATNNYNLFRVRDRAACEPSLEAVFEERSRRARLIFSENVMVWLLSSVAYSKVYCRLFPDGFREREQNEVEKIRRNFVDGSFEILCRAAERCGEGEFSDNRRRYYHARARVFGDDGTFRWIRSLVDALREYHYGDAAAIMAQRRKTYHQRINRVMDAIRSIREIASDDVAMELVRIMYDGANPFARFKSKKFDEAGILQCLKDMSEVDPDVLYPISRLDGTARARVFVYRISEANWREFGSHKPAQIAELMSIEGFEVQLDQRTIERQCSSFESMDKRYWKIVEDTAGGAAYMKRRRELRQLLEKKQ